jgi:hypothetical protein
MFADGIGSEGIEALQAEEAECLRKFHNKAAAIRFAEPKVTKQIALARAIEALPRTATRYQFIRHRLGLAGVRALPLLK